MSARTTSGMALRHGPHQRRLTARRLSGIDVGAASQQQLDGLDPPGLRCRHQRRHAGERPTFGVGARAQQLLHERCVAIGSRPA